MDIGFDAAVSRAVAYGSCPELYFCLEDSSVGSVDVTYQLLSRAGEWEDIAEDSVYVYSGVFSLTLPKSATGWVARSTNVRRIRMALSCGKAYSVGYVLAPMPTLDASDDVYDVVRVGWRDATIGIDAVVGSSGVAMCDGSCVDGADEDGVDASVGSGDGETGAAGSSYNEDGSLDLVGGGAVSDLEAGSAVSFGDDSADVSASTGNADASPDASSQAGEA